MAWLNSLLKKPESTPEIEEQIEDTGPLAPGGPLLAILVPDTGGVSSFRLRPFETSADAAQHIGTLFPQVRRGVHAFWGLHNPPGNRDDLKVEALVMIRAEENSDLVYIVSFLDLESAYSFTRFEVRRGLQLTNVMIYWAVFADITEDATGITIKPSHAPVSTLAQGAVHSQVTYAQPEPAAYVEPAIAEPEPIVEQAPIFIPGRAVETIVETEAREAVEHYLRQAAEDDATAAADAAATARAADELEAEAEFADDEPMWPEANTQVIDRPAPQVIQPEPELEPELVPFEAPVVDEDLHADVIAPLWPEAAASSDVIEAPELVAPIAEEEVDELLAEAKDPAEQEALKQAFVLHHEVPTALLKDGIEAGMIDVEGEPLVPTGVVIAFAGDEEIEGHAAPVIADTEQSVALDKGYAASTVESIAGDEELEEIERWKSPDPELPSAFKRFDEFDVAYEVERLLKRRSLDKRDGPFHGFESPPGRF